MEENNKPKLTEKKQNTSTLPKPSFTKPKLGSNEIKEKKSQAGKHLPVIVLIFLSSATFGFVGGYYGSTQSDNVAETSVQASQQIIDSESELITQIANEVGESVVSIDVTAEETGQSFFGGPRSFTQASAGTGVIISDDGVIITNRHVIPDNVSSVNITLSDGTTLEDVEVIGKTNSGDSLDIGFLKINDAKGKELKAAKIGDSAAMKVGDKVIAIGNALGQFQNTVTSGIISGYGRTIEAGDSRGFETLQNLFQTDASINQGNSGGPLVNVQGEVIGINTAIAGGDAEGIGFAIPIADVQGLITSVLEKGELLRPYLGVRYVTITDDYAYEYNLDVNRGAYLAPSQDGQATILKDSPAEKAELKEKDIIIRVNDQDIDENNSLVSALGKYSVDDTVTLTILRDGQEITVDVKLEALPKS